MAHFSSQHLGTRQDMQALEEEFLVGDYNPVPPVNSRPPPAKKARLDTPKTRQEKTTG